MDIGVVVVNWNSGGRLERLLEALSPVAERLQGIVVVDNASQDASAERCRSKGIAGLEVVCNRSNLGFAAGANRGIACLSSDWILLLNPDVVPLAGSLETFWKRCKDYPDAALLCGPLLSPQGRPQTEFQFRSLPSWRSVLSDALFLDELNLGAKRTDRTLSQSPQEVEQPAAAYWFLRRAAWTEVGGFDEAFCPAWFEDVDFCKRLDALGWKRVCLPACPAQHEGGYTLESLGRRRFLRIYYGNLLRYLRKHHRRSYPLLWLPVKLGLGVRLALGLPGRARWLLSAL